MADVALRRLQIALEGPYTSGAGPLNAAQLSIYNGLAVSAVPATRRLSIEKGVGNDFEFMWEQPVEARGTYAGRYQTILHQYLAKGKTPVFFYPDDMTWYGRMLFSGTPNCQTLPSSAVALSNVASALAVPTTAGALPAVTTQPNTINSALGSMLSLSYTTTSTSSVLQSFTIVGTSVSGAALTEIVTFFAGTQTIWFNYYSATVGGVATNAWQTSAGASSATTANLCTKNYFATVTSITSSANAPASTTLSVGSVNAFQWNFFLDTSASTLYSASGEYYDGSEAWSLPGLVAEKYTLTAQIGKTLKGQLDWSAKTKAALAAYVSATGNATGGFEATPGSINSGASAGTFNALGNLTDNITNAIPTYTAKVYAINIGSDPSTGTQILARLTDFKWDLDNKIKLGKAADGTPNPNFVGRDFYGEGLTAEFTMLLNESNSGASAGTTGFEVTQFINAQSRTLLWAFPGVALPCGTLGTASNWPNWGQDANSKGGYYGLGIEMSGKYIKAVEKEADLRQAISFTMDAEVDLTFLNAPAQVILINRISPVNSF